mgnify:CR=1 FL=1
MMKKRIYIKGFLNKNLGDDLFVKILIERYPNVKFEMYSEVDYKKVYKSKNLKIYTNKSLVVIFRKLVNLFFKLIKSEKRIQIENIKKYDAIVMIGGSLFIEYPEINYDQYFNNNYNTKRPLYIIGANFGPYKTEKYLEFHRTRVFSKAKDICFRDRYSYNLFKKMSNVRYSPDIVFSLDTSKIKVTEKNIVIISVINCKKDTGDLANQEEYNKKINDFITYFVAKGYEIILMSFSQIQGDEEVINQIIASNKQVEKIKKYFYRGNIEEALNLIASAQIIVGTRFHANILGLVFNKTIIPIAYSNKMINTLNDINFLGKKFNLKEIDELSSNNITENDLHYKLDISEYAEKANAHFEKLDKFLKGDK